MSAKAHYPDVSPHEVEYRKLALETVTSEALFNGQDYPQVLLRGRFDPWANFDESSPVAGSVTVVQFPEQSKAEISEYGTPDSLRTYFSTDHRKRGKHVRRLFILEGLDARMIEVLGSRLQIHPGVFIAHSTDPGYFDMMDADGFLHNPSQYWIAQVQQLHHMSDGFYDEPGVYLNDKIKPKRLAGRFIRRSPPLSFTSHLVTFWSRCHDDGSWEAMIIVDPLYRPTVCKPPGKPDFVSITGRAEFTIKEDLQLLPRVPRIHATPLSADHTKWNNRPAPTSESIKDRLIDMYQRYDHLASGDPASAAWYCQGIIFSMWNMVIHALEGRYMELWDNELFAWHHDRNVKWRVEEYQRFSSQQLVARRIKKDYLDVCRKMGIDINLDRSSTSCTSKARSWKWLLERLNTLEDQIGDMMNMSTQRASVEESIHSGQQTQSANEQARDVGRLTAFAAVLVPFTVVSGIFSMGGEYGVGQQSFWVFWAVALPVSCITVICLLYMASISSELKVWRGRALKFLQKTRNSIKARLGGDLRTLDIEKNLT